MSTNSYSTSYYTANPYASTAVSAYTDPTSTSVSSSSTSDYLAKLEAQAEASAAAILEQYELAASQAYSDKNDMISLAQQEYLKNINPYGTTSESLSAYGFDSTGGYSVSNAQSSYANYINSQNVANALYSDTITDLKIEAINSQLENEYFYTDLTAELMSDMESIYADIVSSQQSATTESEALYQENLMSALEFVETLYNIAPSKISTDNVDLEIYLDKVYGVSGSDFDFIVTSVLDLLGKYGFVENDFWNTL